MANAITIKAVVIRIPLPFPVVIRKPPVGRRAPLFNLTGVLKNEHRAVSQSAW
jgi:hypothetical protein